MSRVRRTTAEHLALDRFQSPDPPPPPRRGRALRLVARLVLWTLIALGALRGFGPLPGRSGEDTATTTTTQLPQGSREGGSIDPQRSTEQAAMAIASAFLRDYLTINDDHGAWTERLKPYLTRGLDLGTSVSVPAGTSQYVDYAQPVNERSVLGGLGRSYVAWDD